MSYNRRISYITVLVYTIIGIMLVGGSVNIYTWNMQWKKAYINGINGITGKTLSEYNKLSESLFTTSEFYYNWAYMLSEIGKIDEAIFIINKCKIVDYDTQMLKGNLYASKGSVSKALQFYREASDMCPNRFIPLYAQFLLYESHRMQTEKNYIGCKILYKEEKITSSTIEIIKRNVSNSIHK